MSDRPAPIAQVENLHVSIAGIEILRGVSFNLYPGKTLGVVGESGCGKTMTGLTLMGMLPGTAKMTADALDLAGDDMRTANEATWRQRRGTSVAMVMQDPFTSLHPMMRVGDQIGEVLRLHRGMSKDAALKEAIVLLNHVGVPEPAASARKFPHQMSGGQRQRVVIAAAFAARPKVIVADEPTTALDVTLQAQILRLLRKLQQEEGTAVMLITHDIGVVASMADEVAVFYAGRIVEKGGSKAVLHHPQHPYTQALLAAVPQPGQNRLVTISGQPPKFGDLPVGCSFAPRCPKRFEQCSQDPKLMTAPTGAEAACWLVDQPVATN